MMVKKKKINIKNLGGGQDKPPWTGYPPPLYQLHVVSSFPTLKKVYKTGLVILNPLLFYIKVVQMVKKKNQHKKPGWGGEINRPGQVAPHPTQVPFFSIFLTLKTSL